MNDVQTLLKRATDLELQSVPFALVTVIRALAPTSAKPGDKAIVCEDGTIYGWIGGGCAQPAVIRTVRQSLADGKPRNVRITPQQSGEEILEDIIEFTMTCHSGGTIDLFVEPVVPKPELVVFGASPVAQALASLGPRVGFQVDWVGAEVVALTHASDEVRRIAEQELDRVRSGAFAVVATQGKGDLQGLKGALAIHARHIAFVASQRKGDILKESLLGAGFDAQAVSAIEAPAGQPIGAQTPEEIALSVLASLVARRRAAVHAESPSPAPEKAAAPAESGQHACCGGKAHLAEPAPVETAAPKAAVKHSCCGE